MGNSKKMVPRTKALDEWFRESIRADTEGHVDPPLARREQLLPVEAVGHVVSVVLDVTDQQVPQNWRDVDDPLAVRAVLQRGSVRVRTLGAMPDVNHSCLVLKIPQVDCQDRPEPDADLVRTPRVGGRRTRSARQS